MSTLADRIREVSPLSERQADHLRTLCSSWQVLADLSFSDLLLYVGLPAGDRFEVVAQVRPLTSQTLYPHDMVGTRVTQPEQPIVERAFREGRIWRQDDPVLVDGIAIRMDAVPVLFDGSVVGVVTKEGSPGTFRRLGRLEEVYLANAEHVSRMIAAGLFPFAPSPGGEWPRVGEGLIVLDADRRVRWASPNALSSLHRLGVRQVVEGQPFTALGLDAEPLEVAAAERTVADGELVRGGATVRLRVLPLLQEGRWLGALILSRDVSEIRQKERELSVKDTTIREIHHRVKNNLQTIASLLRLQGRRASTGEAKAALQESVLRVGAIALVHETLSERASEVAEFGEVARRIGRMVAEGLVLPDQQVQIDVSGETGAVGPEIATPLAVALTELIQNAVEHAFPDGRAGRIAVDLARHAGEVEARVVDDGVGMPPEPSPGTRLGLQIVRALVAELNGEVVMGPSPDGPGTTAAIRIPVA